MNNPLNNSIDNLAKKKKKKNKEKKDTMQF